MAQVMEDRSSHSQSSVPGFAQRGELGLATVPLQRRIADHGSLEIRPTTRFVPGWKRTHPLPAYPGLPWWMAQGR